VGADECHWGKGILRATELKRTTCDGKNMLTADGEGEKEREKGKQ
jgi:hypothetical protein